MSLRLQFNALCIVMTLFLIKSAHAEDIHEHPEISNALNELAMDVAKYVKAEPNTLGQIRVGGWDGPAGGGSRICQTLKRNLKDEIELKDFGGYSVSGSYAQGMDEDKHVTVITASVKDPSGNPRHVFKKRVVSDTQSAIELFGANVDLTSASDPDEKVMLVKHGKDPKTEPLFDAEVADAKVREQIADPRENSSIFVSIISAERPVNSVARFSETSPYGVELLVKDKAAPPDVLYTPCVVAVDDGIPHTHIPSEKVYAIRLHNDSDRPVGVSITIDGINLYTFSDNEHWRQLGKTLIRPGGGVIKGWPGRGTSVNEFTIVSYGESAAGRLGGTDGIGSITVVFHPAEIPKNATGIGRELDGGLNFVHAIFSREILGAVSIQYRRPENVLR